MAEKKYLDYDGLKKTVEEIDGKYVPQCDDVTEEDITEIFESEDSKVITT